MSQQLLSVTWLLLILTALTQFTGLNYQQAARRLVTDSDSSLEYKNEDKLVGLGTETVWICI